MSIKSTYNKAREARLGRGRRGSAVQPLQGAHTIIGNSGYGMVLQREHVLREGGQALVLSL